MGDRAYPKSLYSVTLNTCSRIVDVANVFLTVDIGHLQLN